MEDTNNSIENKAKEFLKRDDVEKMISPGGLIPPGLAWCDLIFRQEDPVSRILSCAVIPLDAASPRTFISDLPGGFGQSRGG